MQRVVDVCNGRVRGTGHKGRNSRCSNSRSNNNKSLKYCKHSGGFLSSSSLGFRLVRPCITFGIIRLVVGFRSISTSRGGSVGGVRIDTLTSKLTIASGKINTRLPSLNRSTLSTCTGAFASRFSFSFSFSSRRILSPTRLATLGRTSFSFTFPFTSTTATFLTVASSFFLSTTFLIRWVRIFTCWFLAFSFLFPIEANARLSANGSRSCRVSTTAATARVPNGSREILNVLVVPLKINASLNTVHKESI